jgi:hypothetical protein
MFGFSLRNRFCEFGKFCTINNAPPPPNQGAISGPFISLPASLDFDIMDNFWHPEWVGGWGGGKKHERLKKDRGTTRADILIADDDLRHNKV